MPTLPKKAIASLINSIVDTAQATMVSEDKELLNSGIDAAQRIIGLLLDDTPNTPQVKELLKDITQAISKYDGSVPEEEVPDLPPVE